MLRSTKNRLGNLENIDDGGVSRLTVRALPPGKLSAGQRKMCPVEAEDRVAGLGTVGRNLEALFLFLHDWFDNSHT